MFSEWTDPYDIDNYYGDLNGLLQDIETAPSSSMYYQPPPRQQIDSKPDAPTAPIVNTPTASVVTTGGQTTKSPFEVKPDSIFLDGHPVGHQPLYDILRSGPPAPAQLQPTTKHEGYCNHSQSLQFDWIHMITFIVIILLAGLLIQASCQISNTNAIVRTLLALYQQQNKQ